MKIAELKVEYAEQKLPEVDEMNHTGYGYDSEEDLWDRVIEKHADLRRRT